jgi:hypothetical protein
MKFHKIAKLLSYEFSRIWFMLWSMIVGINPFILGRVFS